MTDENNSTARGYDHKWRKVRAHKLRVDPFCEPCAEVGTSRFACEVDHITPFDGRNDPLRLQWENLQSICVLCHRRKTHGKTTAPGASEDGTPIDPNHPWNQ